MRFLVGLLLILVGMSFAADAVRTLWIESDVQGSWDHAEWFRDELEQSINDLEGFQVIPRRDVAEMLHKAQLDPATRNIPASKMQDSLFPANVRMLVRVFPPIHTEKRTPVLFFMGRRSVQMHVSFQFRTQDSSLKELRGELVADTTFGTGYCGIVDCHVKPQPMQEKLEMEKSLFRNILSQVRGRLEQLVEIPANYRMSRESLDTLSSSSVSSISSSSETGSSSSK